MGLNELNDLFRLLSLGIVKRACFVIVFRRMRDKLQVNLKVLNGFRGAIARRFGGGKFDAAAIRLSKDFSEDRIQPVDKLRSRAEVGAERNEIKKEGGGVGDFQAHFLDAGKQLGVGFAKEIDGLHRVADQEAGTAGAVGPRGDQVGEQLVLTAAGVLELVHQQVANAVGESDCRVAR